MSLISLIIEDNERNLKLVSECLAGQGLRDDRGRDRRGRRAPRTRTHARPSGPRWTSGLPNIRADQPRRFASCARIQRRLPRARVIAVYRVGHRSRIAAPIMAAGFDAHVGKPISLKEFWMRCARRWGIRRRDDAAQGHGGRRYAGITSSCSPDPAGGEGLCGGHRGDRRGGLLQKIAATETGASYPSIV